MIPRGFSGRPVAENHINFVPRKAIPRACKICGRDYLPAVPTQKACGAKECKRAMYLQRDARRRAR